MRIVRLCLGAALAMGLVAAGFAHADVDETGTNAASFLTLGSGARILSMGGATLGLGDDLAASAWNPAALGWMERGEIVLSHAGLGNGTMQEWAGLGARWGEKTSWSISGLYQGEGSFEGRDASNISTGDFNVSSFAFGAHVARRFGDMLTIGAGAKAVNENLGTVSGFGATFDFGASVHAGDFGFGLAAQNLGGQMKYDGAVYSFPGSFGAGVSYAMPSTGLRLALDANFPQSYYNDVRFGAEWMWNDMVAVRAGYRKELTSGDIADGGEDLLSGPTFGMGAGRNGFWFDYGYLVSGGETQHRIGLRFTPGGFGNYGKVDQPSVAPRKPAAPRTTPAPKTGGRPTIPVTSTTAKPVAPAKESGDDDVPVPAAKAAVPVETPPKPAVTTPVQAKSAPTKVGSKATPTKIGDLSPAPPATKAVTPATAPSSAPATKPAVKATETKPLAIKPVVTKAAETKPAETKPAETKQPEAKQPETKPVVAKQAEAKPVESKPEEAKVSEPKPSEATQPASEPAEQKEIAARAEEKPAEAKPAEVKEAKKEEKRKPEPAKVGPRPAKVKVKSGETLAIIAKRYGLSPAAIMMENNMVRDTVKPGQTLRLPREN
jgi:LysM repeat protein